MLLHNFYSTLYAALFKLISTVLYYHELPAAINHVFPQRFGLQKSWPVVNKNTNSSGDDSGGGSGGSIKISLQLFTKSSSTHFDNSSCKLAACLYHLAKVVFVIFLLMGHRSRASQFSDEKVKRSSMYSSIKYNHDHDDHRHRQPWAQCVPAGVRHLLHHFLLRSNAAEWLTSYRLALHQSTISSIPTLCVGDLFYYSHPSSHRPVSLTFSHQTRCRRSTVTVS